MHTKLSGHDQGGTDKQTNGKHQERIKFPEVWAEKDYKIKQEVT